MGPSFYLFLFLIVASLKRREMYDKLNQNKSPLTLVQPDPRQGTQLAEVKLSHCQVIMYVESLWYLSFIYYDLAT